MCMRRSSGEWAGLRRASACRIWSSVSRSVMSHVLARQRVFEGSPSRVEPPLGGADGNAEASGDLRDGMLFEVVQGEDRPLVERQSIECPLEGVAIVDTRVAGTGSAIRRHFGGHPRETDLPDPPPSPEGLTAFVEHDLAQPGPEPCRLPEPWQLSPDRDIRVLDGITRIGLAAEDGAGEPERPIEVAGEKLVERGEVTTLGAPDQRVPRVGLVFSY